jgi:hypothetical protein
MKEDNPYGDDGGTRVGKPDTPKRDNKRGGGDGGGTGAGKEASRGMTNDGKGGKPGSPNSGGLQDHGVDKGSGYGGAMGGPKTSSDNR